jgi:DNA-directed RNA polymerase subunit M/transcription elongation factor TFIIS
MLAITGDGRLLVPGMPPACVRNTPDAISNDELLGGTRKRLRQELVDVLTSTLGANAAPYAAHLEACIVATTGGRHSAYTSTVGRVLHNLSSSAADIVTAYPLSRVCMLSHHKLTAASATAARDRDVDARVHALIARIAEKTEAAKTVAAAQSTQVLKCRSCGATTGLEQHNRQTRSGDEGMTVFVICPCGAKWRLG